MKNSVLIICVIILCNSCKKDVPVINELPQETKDWTEFSSLTGMDKVILNMESNQQGIFIQTFESYKFLTINNTFSYSQPNKNAILEKQYSNNYHALINISEPKYLTIYKNTSKESSINVKAPYSDSISSYFTKELVNSKGLMLAQLNVKGRIELFLYDFKPDANGDLSEKYTLKWMGYGGGLATAINLINDHISLGVQNHFSLIETIFFPDGNIISFNKFSFSSVRIPDFIHKSENYYLNDMNSICTSQDTGKTLDVKYTWNDSLDVKKVYSLNEELFVVTKANEIYHLQFEGTFAKAKKIQLPSLAFRQVNDLAYYNNTFYVATGSGLFFAKFSDL